MPIRHAVWTVGASPAPLREGRLGTEATLEAMILAAPALLSDQWMLVGQQEDTGAGGRVDLLALAPDGTLILIELKRGRTPREVVAQALDYGAWVEGLDAAAVGRLYAGFRQRHGVAGADLAHDFRERFRTPLDETAVDGRHQLVIVAEALDASSERIVAYLARRGVAINVLCFQVFDAGPQPGSGQLLSRAWLMDPAESQIAATEGRADAEREPWNGEYYVSFGDGDSRAWEDARLYGFVSAGGGAWYSGTLGLLKAGDRIWVRIPAEGYVGVGRVSGPVVPLAEFRLPGPDGTAVPAEEVLTGASYHRTLLNPEENGERFVPVEWLATVPRRDAVHVLGMFGNQNTVCAPKVPRWRHTLDQLKPHFSGWDKPGASAG